MEVCPHGCMSEYSESMDVNRYFCISSPELPDINLFTTEAFKLKDRLQKVSSDILNRNHEESTVEVYNTLLKANPKLSDILAHSVRRTHAETII